MELVINIKGTARMVYQEEVDFSALGQAAIQRASHVEPDEQGRWWSDLSPTCGPVLGPYEFRTDAVRAEIEWIALRLAKTFEVSPS